MDDRKVLMKIDTVRYGAGGYDDAMFGISWSFSGDGCGVGDFWGSWGLDYDRSEYAKWSDAERNALFLDAQLRLERVLKAAKVRWLHELVGKPVEVTFDGLGWGSRLKEWRILTEVL